MSPVPTLRRTYLGLGVLRRLPLGLLVPLFVRYPMGAGLDLAEVGLLPPDEAPREPTPVNVRRASSWPARPAPRRAAAR